MTDRAAKALLDLLAGLTPAGIAALQRELQQLRAIRGWAIGQVCNFAVGDTVAIADGHTVKSGGWWLYREALAPGARATVLEIDFNTHRGDWYASIMLEREWSVAEIPGRGVVRYWHGAAVDTPDGYEPPTPYDREHHPEGRRHTFMINVKWLRSLRPAADVTWVTA